MVVAVVVVLVGIFFLVCIDGIRPEGGCCSTVGIADGLTCIDEGNTSGGGGESVGFIRTDARRLVRGLPLRERGRRNGPPLPSFAAVAVVEISFPLGYVVADGRQSPCGRTAETMAGGTTTSNECRSDGVIPMEREDKEETEDDDDNEDSAAAETEEKGGTCSRESAGLNGGVITAEGSRNKLPSGPRLITVGVVATIRFTGEVETMVVVDVAGLQRRWPPPPPSSSRSCSRDSPRSAMKCSSSGGTEEEGEGKAAHQFRGTPPGVLLVVVQGLRCEGLSDAAPLCLECRSTRGFVESTGVEEENETDNDNDEEEGNRRRPPSRCCSFRFLLRCIRSILSCSVFSSPPPPVMGLRSDGCSDPTIENPTEDRPRSSSSSCSPRPPPIFRFQYPTCSSVFPTRRHGWTSLVLPSSLDIRGASAAAAGGGGRITGRTMGSH